MIPSNVIIAQGMLVYRLSDTPGQTPQILQVMCNCSSSPRERTARFVDANRHLFITADAFTKGEWQ